MFNHKCHIDDMVILGNRPNPLNGLWQPWCLCACNKCKKIQEWQIHSEEYMHGGALELTAFPAHDYITKKYNLEPQHIEEILNGKRKPIRFELKGGVYVAT